MQGETLVIDSQEIFYFLIGIMVLHLPVFVKTYKTVHYKGGEAHCEFCLVSYVVLPQASSLFKV